ncbi:hypothetical protein GC173_16585 [bacterium]|nr:hypothetical protein [bacterium]
MALLEKDGGLVIWILEGAVTGWESFAVFEDPEKRRKNLQSMMQSGWGACAGSEEWDSLSIPPEELAKAFRVLFPEDNL